MRSVTPFARRDVQIESVESELSEIFKHEESGFRGPWTSERHPLRAKSVVPEAVPWRVEKLGSQHGDVDGVAHSMTMFLYFTGGAIHFHDDSKKGII